MICKCGKKIIFDFDDAGKLMPYNMFIDDLGALIVLDHVDFCTEEWNA